MFVEESADLAAWTFADLRAALPGPVELFLERDALCCVNWASTPGLGAAMREMAAHDPDGGVLCVDPGPLTVAGARALLAALRSLGTAYDVVVSVNEDEAAQLGEAVGVAGDPTDASLLDAVRARADGTGGVDEASVVVHGTDAAVAATPVGRVTVPTLDVSPGPTETGAGDRFSGALARSLAAGWDWEVALAAGNACATHYVSGRGTATRSTLLDHVVTHDPS
nr:PfkB family carbohydrate kinase [Haloplanus ruber]